MDKKYENVDISVDEKSGYVSISKHGSHVASYWVKTDEETEYLKDRYTSKAISSLTSVSLALVIPAAYLGISNFLNMNTLKSFMQHPLMGLLLIVGYLFAAAFCGYFVTIALVLVAKIFNLERAAREDKLAKIIFAAVALLVVLILLTLIPVKEAFY